MVGDAAAGDPATDDDDACLVRAHGRPRYLSGRPRSPSRSTSPDVGMNDQSYELGWRTNRMTPWLPADRTSLCAGHRREAAQHRAAGPDDELAHAPRLVLAPGRILRSEPLVVVVVPVDDDIGAGPVERVPERPDRGVAAVLAGAEPRVMPDRQRAHARSTPRGPPPASDPGRSPGHSRRRSVQSESRTITCHAPRSYEYQLVPSGAARAPK